MFDESDVGEIKVEVAARKLQKLNLDVQIEALPLSVNDYNAIEVIDGCDVVIDALDSVNARYSINKACIEKKIPFVTGAAVGVSGQTFTVLPKTSACYHCMFPSLDEDSMPTCSIEGVHPSILSIIGGIEVSEAVKIILGKKPSLSDRILHVDLENLDFSYTQTFKADECPVCGTGTKEETTKQEMIIEELCGRNGGKRTFSLSPTSSFDLDVEKVTKIAKDKGFKVENQGELGISMSTNDLSVSFLKKGSAVLVGSKDEQDAITLYKELLGRKAVAESH